MLSGPVLSGQGPAGPFMPGMVHAGPRRALRPRRGVLLDLGPLCPQSASPSACLAVASIAARDFLAWFRSVVNQKSGSEAFR
ncbi:hypothetical protein GCM10027073_37370 [Streptomyces chlorus]